MILSSSGASWLKLLLLLLVPFLAILGWAWLSSYLFLSLAGLDASTAGPTTIYQYWYYYGSDPKTKAWLTLSCLGGAAVIVLPIFMLLSSKTRRALFGDAKWATHREIADAGLFADDGIVVGQVTRWFGFVKQYLVFGGDEHVLMSAPTRSGKGVGVVVPTLQTFKDSVVVLDSKQENFDMTAGFRAAHGHECFLVNFATENYKSHRWNPLFYISDDPAFRINDIQKIGGMLFPKIKNEAPIWQSSARSLWLGVVLYLCETEDLPVTLGEALRQVTMGDERLAEIVEDRQQGDCPLSDECFLALKEYLDTPEKTRGSVRKSFTSALELLYNPIIDAATSGNDFDLRDLRKKRMSIYLGIVPGDLERLGFLINLFFEQVIDLNTRVLPEHDPSLKYKCLLLMDEFTAMGPIRSLMHGISYIAGYGLRMLPIIQSPAQLRDTYGHDAAETFMENHALQIIFAPKNIKIAKEISESLGTETVKNTSKTKQLIGKGRSESQSDTGRALLLPQEVKNIGRMSEILIMENCPPIRCSKVVWYKDNSFKMRGNGRDGVVHWQTPEVPTVDLSSIVKGKVEYTSTAVKQQEERAVVERPVTVADIESIDQLNLEDFSCDFSKIEVPKGEISEEAMAAIADAFLRECQAA